MAQTYPHPFTASLLDSTEAERPRFGARARARARAALARIGDALTASRRIQAEREVARFIELNGEQLTDELEREISRRFGGPAGGRF